jgi:DNA-binding HxlR family transcriptional regulator
VVSIEFRFRYLRLSFKVLGICSYLDDGRKCDWEGRSSGVALSVGPSAGGAGRWRAGACTVGMLSEELNVKIMRAMAGGFDALTLGTSEVPPEVEADPDEPKYVITQTGRERLPIVSAIDYWLMKAPEGGLAYDDEGAEATIEALAEAWGCGLMHALGYGPRTVSELHNALEGPDRHPVEHLLEKMHRARLLESRQGEGGKGDYEATEWLRRGIAPLLVAARVERRDAPEGAAPIDALDVEGALMLTVPLLRLPQDLSGSCRLSVRMSSGSQAAAGVTVSVEEGRIAGCSPGLDSDAAGEAAGNIRAWFRAIVDGGSNRLDYSGERPLARALVDELSEVLFGAG